MTVTIHHTAILNEVLSLNAQEWLRGMMVPYARIPQ